MKNKIDSTSKIGINTIIGDNVIIEENVIIGNNSIIKDNVIIKKDSIIGDFCIIGEFLKDYYSNNNNYKNPITMIGKNSIIRSMTIIYADNKLGDNLETGHRVTIRERSDIGKNVRIGTLCDIQGDCKLGNYVRLHSNIFVPEKTKIGNYVWIFPNCTFTNDPTPPSNELFGIVVEDFVSIAAKVTILPGLRIGKGSFIGASSLLTKDVNRYEVYAGNPAKYICNINDLKNKFTDEYNYPWMYNFDRGMPWKDIGFEKWINDNNVEL